MSQQEALMDTAIKVAALMEQFERRCEQLEQHQLALADQLRQVVQQIPMTLRRSADENLHALPDAVMRGVQGELDKPVHAFEQRLRESQDEIHSSTQTLSKQLQAMQSLHKQLIWKTTGTVLGSLLLLLLGGAWLSWQYRQDIRQNQIAADLLLA